MSNIHFISDLHAGHKNIMDILRSHDQAHLRGNAKDTKEMEEWLIEQWNSKIGKRDTIYVLGDAVFNTAALKTISKLRGNKILLRGNHDKLSTEKLLTVFGSLIGFQKKFGFWLSHAPIHPCSLRGAINIHGHLHAQDVLIHNSKFVDRRYVNASVEKLNGIPLSLDSLRREIAGVKAVCHDFYD